MKILVYGGGLGNQLFEYAFTLYIKRMYPNQRVFGVYSRARLNEHNGMEIDKWFDVNLPQSSLFTTFITYCLYAIKKITGWTGLLDLCQTVMKKDDALVYFAQHTDKRYIPDGEWIKFKLTNEILGERNLILLQQIENSNSVFVHIRRGDYLSPKYKDRFDGCCTIDYYNEAIKYVNEHIENTQFYVFSNDIDWCKNNLPLSSAMFIDWNTGEFSALDMYLMSKCKACIIANSTFSYWGAMLGRQKEIVVYPDKWINPPFQVGDLFPEEWVKI